MNFLYVNCEATSRYLSASCDGKKSIVLCFISSPKVYSWVWLLFLKRNVCATVLYPTRYIKLFSRVYSVNMSIMYLSIFPSNIQLLIVNFCLFFTRIFLRFKPKPYKKCQYSWLFKKFIWKLINQNKFFDGSTYYYWRNIWRSIIDEVERLGLTQ